MTEEEWLERDDPEIMVQLLKAPEDKLGTDRKWVLFSSVCCRQAIPYLNEQSWLSGIEFMERLADGPDEVGQIEIEIKEAEIRAAYKLISDDSESPGAARKCAAGAIEMLVTQHPDVAAGMVILYALRIAEIEGRRPERGIELCCLLRDIFGNPFSPVTLNPRWLTSTVLDLARLIYDERAFERMPILADALMDAGCDNDDIIQHCQGPGPHVLGCWVVDLLLGKT